MITISSGRKQEEACWDCGEQLSRSEAKKVQQSWRFPAIAECVLKMEQKLMMKVILKLFLHRLSLCLFDQMRHGTDVSKKIEEVNASEGV